MDTSAMRPAGGPTVAPQASGPGGVVRWRIGKSFRFEATRRLPGGGYDGGSFTAVAELSATRLDDVGFVVDFGRLNPLKHHIEDALDHRDLTEQMPDVSDEGVGAYLTDWSRRHLAADIAAALGTVRVRTGRSRPGGDLAIEFGATHWLDGLPAGHPCARRHGHSYLVTARAGTPSREVAVPEALRDHLAHSMAGTVLNELEFNPTSENLAGHLLSWARRHGLTAGAEGLAVRVSETETSWAEAEVAGP